jgi:hypothetical protein
MKLPGAAMAIFPSGSGHNQDCSRLAVIRSSLVSGRPLVIRRTSAIGTNLVSPGED